MNKDMINKAKEINEEIINTKLYQRYLELKKMIDNKYYLQEEDIKLLQQDLVKLAYLDEKEFIIKKEEYLNKKDIFLNDIIIKEYIEIYLELNKMIYEIKNILEV